MRTAVVLLSLMVLIFLGATFFPVIKIDCQTQFGHCSDDLLNMLPDFTGQKWLASVPNFQNYPGVQKITVSKRIPGVVSIDIFLRKNLAVIYSLANQVQVAVDDTGLLVEIKNSSNLPRLMVEEPLEIGKNVSQFQLKACQYLYEASSIIRLPLSAKIAEQNLEISVPKNLIIIISLTKNASNWQSSLQSILARSKIDGKIPQKIDLRFENPVVVYLDTWQNQN